MQSEWLGVIIILEDWNSEFYVWRIHYAQNKKTGGYSTGGYGGADWKISSACAFLLGWARGMSGMVLGLLIGVIFTMIYNKIKNRNMHEGFPLVPFISIGMMTVFFI